MPHTARTRSGLPLSLNRPPAPDLAPWVARVVAARIDASPDARIDCGMCNDVPYVRSLIGGHWTAETAEGLGRYRHQALLFGPHSRHMAISCTGEIYTAGFGLKPGALHGLAGIPAGEILDRIMPCDRLGLPQAEFAGLFSPEDPPESWLLALEAALRRHIARVGARHPDPVTTAFDLAAFADPNLSVRDFADRHDISPRMLLRIVRRDFGMTPKHVLRRARTLDLASQLCGVADEREEAELLLRYSDESHLIKEFIAFFGVTPRQFRERPRPLLTLNLETRQARRLEELQRIDPAGPRPWRSDS
jgi:AraC-like DNA-binding protein